MEKPIRVRFAPSPTGLLHIGGLRTALYNYLFSRHHGGSFVLRIEDTDRKRYVHEAEEDILTSLTWAGLVPDEGPFAPSGSVGFDSEKIEGVQGNGRSEKGDFGPYRQSARRERYLRYAEQLVETGHAYYAFDTVGEIEIMRERFRTPDNAAPRYDARTRMKMRNSLTLNQQELQELLEEGAEYVIRLKMPSGGEISFGDMVRGHVSFESDLLDDQVLLKADGMPTYHLANVVDDHEMKISHVIRGEEWLSSTPKHIYLYRCLGWDPPEMAHLPLIMSPGGGKLSKRKADQEGIPVNVRDYISGKYERDAVINFLALLGWSPGDYREFLTLDEMITAFSMGRVGKSPAVFDHQKLIWFNEHYMRKRSNEDLATELSSILNSSSSSKPGSDAVAAASFATPAESPPVSEQRHLDTAWLAGVAGLLRDRVSHVNEFLTAGYFLFEAPKAYEEKALKKAWKSGTGQLVRAYRNHISELDDTIFKPALLKEILEKVVNEKGVGFGKLMLPVRLAVTGTGSGPDLFETMALLGRPEVVHRLDLAVERLEDTSDKTNKEE